MASLRVVAACWLLCLAAAKSECRSSSEGSTFVQSRTSLSRSLANTSARMPPNENCCNDAGDPAACHALHDVPFQYENVGGITRMKCPNSGTDCAFDHCVGGTGVDCVGVPYDLDFGVMGTLSVNLVAPQDNGDGTVTLKTSVGSILHDLCCMEHQSGAFCHSSNYPIGATINVLGNANNNCACLMEWRKAAWNVLRGRYWLATFTKAAQSQDMTPDTSVQRKSYLPKGSGTNYESYKSTWGLTERKATSVLCAPGGTRLDCPSEDNNCKVPCVGTYCKACATGCASRHRKRWNKDGRDHANAGDSDYCCSGQFKEVYWSLANTRYGTCA
ncbi:rnf181 [Symbiodinium natans]|uniref:Rnf181 protein n=1 Tax=Symbiodinium natans TaxID=878477 RepID=A0A812MUR7_9DINO|nr:rnf181 [Symbiodinium natans]